MFNRLIETTKTAVFGDANKQLSPASLSQGYVGFLLSQNFAVTHHVVDLKDGSSYYSYWVAQKGKTNIVFFSPARDIPELTNEVVGLDVMPYMFDIQVLVEHYRHQGYLCILPIAECKEFVGSLSTKGTRRKHWVLMALNKETKVFYDPKSSGKIGLHKYPNDDFKEFARISNTKDLPKAKDGYTDMEKGKHHQGFLDMHNCGYYVLAKAVEISNTEIETTTGQKDFIKMRLDTIPNLHKAHKYYSGIYRQSLKEDNGADMYLKSSLVNFQIFLSHLTTFIKTNEPTLKDFFQIEHLYPSQLCPKNKNFKEEAVFVTYKVIDPARLLEVAIPKETEATVKIDEEDSGCYIVKAPDEDEGIEPILKDKEGKKDPAAENSFEIIEGGGPEEEDQGPNEYEDSYGNPKFF